MRILVIEDEPGIAHFIRQELSEAGYAVDVTAARWQAVEKILLQAGSIVMGSQVAALRALHLRLMAPCSSVMTRQGSSTMYGIKTRKGQPSSPRWRNLIRLTQGDSF